MVIAFFLLFSLSTFAQEVEFKTKCEDRYCVITAHVNTVYMGYIKLDGCRISCVKVFPEFRRRGLAKALLAQAGAQAASHNCKKVDLVTFKELVGYYQRNGFTCDSHCICTQPV